MLAHDVEVRVRRPWLMGLLSLLTLGAWGAVHHFLLSRDIARFGRARGQMPFPFTPVAPGASTLAWVAGLLAWYGVVAALASWLFRLFDGYDPATEDVTSFVSLGLLLAPLWLVALHTLRRIRTVQHLAGTAAPYPSPLRGAALYAMLPPLGSWHAQRQLNRAWRVYR